MESTSLWTNCCGASSVWSGLHDYGCEGSVARCRNNNEEELSSRTHMSRIGADTACCPELNLVGSNGNHSQCSNNQASTHNSCNGNLLGRNNPNASFPIKLRAMLDAADVQGFSAIVSWQLDGTAFRVHQPKLFVQQVLRKWFNQTKYKSFQRQLNLYGFSRVIHGPPKSKGCYVHEKFLRDHPELTQEVVRKKVEAIDGEQDDQDCCLIDDGQDYLELAPTWLPNAASVLEPRPIKDTKNSTVTIAGAPAAAQTARLVPISGSGAKNDACAIVFSSIVAATNTNPEMDAFEKLCQANVATEFTPPLSSTAAKCCPVTRSPNDYSLIKAGPENALLRILDELIEPESHSAERKQEGVPLLHETNSTTGRKKCPRPSVFPDRLHDMLDYCHADPQLKKIACWERHGQAFRIGSMERFRKEILNKFFKTNRFESLQRQLNLYGFHRIQRGPMKGCYHHPLFVQGGRNLSKDMQRRKRDEFSTCCTSATDSSSFSSSSSVLTKDKKQSPVSPSIQNYRDPNEFSNGAHPVISSINDSVAPLPLPILYNWDEWEDSFSEFEDEIDYMARGCVNGSTTAITPTKNFPTLFRREVPSPNVSATTLSRFTGVGFNASCRPSIISRTINFDGVVTGAADSVAACNSLMGQMGTFADPAQLQLQRQRQQETAAKSHCKNNDMVLWWRPVAENNDSGSNNIMGGCGFSPTVFYKSTRDGAVGYNTNDEW